MKAPRVACLYSSRESRLVRRGTRGTQSLPETRARRRGPARSPEKDARDPSRDRPSHPTAVSHDGTSRRARAGASSVFGRSMSDDARVPGSPRRGRRRGRSWSRSRSRSPRGRRLDDVEGEGQHRSRSRSSDEVLRDDRRGLDQPPRTSRDTARQTRETRETLPARLHSDRTNRPGVGLGYRPEEDRALRAALGTRGTRGTRVSSARASGLDSRGGFASIGGARVSGHDSRRPEGDDYNPLRRKDEIAARRAREKPTEPFAEGRTTSSAAPSTETFPWAVDARVDASRERVASGSLGWRASSGALPRRAEAIEGVGDETLASLTASLRETRETNRRRRETMARLARDACGSGFETLELRRAFSRRVGAAKTVAPADSRDARRAERAEHFLETFPKNRGVADRARADEETAFGSERTVSSFANARNDAEARADDRSGGARLAEGVVDVRDATRRDEDAPGTTRALPPPPPPPPPLEPRGDDDAARARKRDRLLALRNRGRERATTHATDACTARTPDDRV